MKKYMIIILLFTPIFTMGFNLDKTIIPRDEILAGGPPKDGIPAIMEPKFNPPEKAVLMEPDYSVIGVQIGHQSRAYPIRILNWHEVVNDTIDGVPIVVTF